MSLGHIGYMSLWTAACVYAVYLLIRDRTSFVVFRRAYYDYLFQGWKVATFGIACSAFVFLSPYMGDPTWDYIDGAFMSILTYITAPWCVAALYATLKRQAGWRVAYVAICAWLFTASWSYDGYLVLRDGVYPSTWRENLAASSVLYLAAGLFWNLAYDEHRGVMFGFMQEGWPQANASGHFRKLLWFAIPLMLLVAGVFVPFLW